MFRVYMPGDLNLFFYKIVDENRFVFPLLDNLPVTGFTVCNPWNAGKAAVRPEEMTRFTTTVGDFSMDFMVKINGLNPAVVKQFGEGNPSKKKKEAAAQQEDQYQRVGSAFFRFGVDRR